MQVGDVLSAFSNELGDITINQIASISEESVTIRSTTVEVASEGYSDAMLALQKFQEENNG
jgi:hypothetical protein